MLDWKIMSQKNLALLHHYSMVIHWCWDLPSPKSMALTAQFEH